MFIKDANKLALPYKFVPVPPFDTYENGTIMYSQGNNEGRRIVQLTYNKVPGGKPRTIMLLSRYMFAVNLWHSKQQHIPPGYEVDHIDNNKMNDNLNNFQLLTKSENVIKKNVLRGKCIAILICPVCIKHFEKPIGMTQYNKTNIQTKINRRINENGGISRRVRAHDRAVYCCSHRCHLALDMTLLPRDKHTELRDWISANQIYQIIRVWSDGRSSIDRTISTAMLDFSLSESSGCTVDYGSPRFASQHEKRAMAREYKAAGLSYRAIGLKMDLTAAAVCQIIGEPYKKYWTTDERERVLCIILEHRVGGYTIQQIADILEMPRTSVSTLIRNHLRDKLIGKFRHYDKSKTPRPRVDRGTRVATVICPGCRTTFDIDPKLTPIIQSRKGRLVYCGSTCQTKVRSELKNNKINKVKIRQWISDNQVISISRLLPEGSRINEMTKSYDTTLLTADFTRLFT